MLQARAEQPHELSNTAAILSIRLNFTETFLLCKEGARQHVVPSEAREVPWLCCVHGVLCVWRRLLWGSLKSSPENQGGEERRHKEEQQEHRLN